jgi:hypothetical protein
LTASSHDDFCRWMDAFQGYHTDPDDAVPSAQRTLSRTPSPPWTDSDSML